MITKTRMGGLLAAVVAGLVGLVAAVPAAVAEPPSTAATGLHISDGRLLESNGNDFVIRGVNHPHAWYQQELDSLAAIKAEGANTVRVVLSSGDQWTETSAAEVSTIVAECKENRLICVLEVHDTTGYGEQGAAVSLDVAADYWIRVQSALAGQEDHVILNIGNEPFGNTHYQQWTADTRAAVGKLRDAGFEHTIMVDAPNWGQDWSNTMRDNAAAVYASDPTGNLIFSVHMYGVYPNESLVSGYLNAFVDAGLPILVGEFGHNHSDGDPDEDAIMSVTQSLGLGYIGWSWSGNGGGVEYLDMVNGFDPNSLTSWGERFLNGPNGIGETSKEATIYAGS
ncbi:glycoside hydrolase family 5 protein [Streptomyces litchfieldiae]|uniref:Glycoside hydrolase family 5 protein n=1 Tax=Streptomyces litchfieldiae TaxID=3075543 RepID=A0ABU2MIZ4_9ACTN|nr:glycoside hydrolase family 5 protein [Streptomyces sp. DSM 44938]MDT0341572.1 glycoside hydrolase family 5 protein [Streptomyces sp. DSM 44938]